MQAPANRRCWLVLVPVKSLATAKSRLALPPPLRSRLAHAMALDTVTAAVSCPTVTSVWVLTEEPAVADDFRHTGAQVLLDAPAAGLNSALRYGAAEALRSQPDAGQAVGVAALPADLPALTGEALAATLAEVPPGTRAVVADAAGTGTTLLAAVGVSLRPAFGGTSHRRHLASGAVDLTAGSRPGLRRDVDTLADLHAARLLSLGRHTAEVLAALDLSR